ncbi:hypothetical protein VB780_14360 [Leptolyngbya sp. CCNP1308]|uniref:hypothetical protein n=1 Tax=Leptolyngbya sp. CCNP1308 TaxID=3110255 RepID=UPI002B1F8E40|nr:hypothetical protein [Leptolyngbya sp. CCNP1308]MEA5449762.1 hypothetical protein [Leptolyngbya sp. CCNP1308]
MSNPRVESDNYDPHIIPAETAARKEREGTDFKQPRDDNNSIDTSSGQTVDKEGLANNYPIEPEMYINEPGDLREEEEAKKAQRAAELSEINQTDETGKVTTDSDERSKGVGRI